MIQKPRLVIIVGGLHPGGAERQLALLLRHAAPHVDAHVCTREAGGSLEPEVAEVDTLHRISGSHSARLRSLSAIVKSVGPHRVVGWHFYTNAYSALVARRHGCSSIGGIRGSLAHEIELQPKAWRFNLHLPNQIVANSRGARDECSALRKNVLYVPNAVEPPDAATSFTRAESLALLGVPGARPVVALIGHLRPEKRGDRFLEALAFARDRGCAWQGLFIGGGPLLATLQSKAAELRLTPDDVKFAGQIAEPKSVMSALDLVAITSDTEGTSNALLEAMAAGVAVLTTRVGELGRSLQSGAEAWLADRSSDDVGRALVQAFDARSRSVIAANGLIRARNEFSLAAALAAWSDALGLGSRLKTSSADAERQVGPLSGRAGSEERDVKDECVG